MADSARDQLPPDADLEPFLHAMLVSAHEAWPALVVSNDAFLAYVGERVTARDPMASLRSSDLYVACACMNGEARALTALEARCFPDVDHALARMKLSAARVDDVKQGLRQHLFVGNGTDPPHLVEYTGRGDLRAWIKVSAVRAALKVLRKEKREVLMEDEALMDIGASGDDPEMQYVKQIFRSQFKTAFQRALDSLTDREKNLLRQHVVDALSIDEVGTLYQVHRATAARWITKARETLLGETRKHFMTHAKISGAECDSIMRMVHSQLDMTIRRRLEEGAEKP
ncbi:MAG: sigma-70 family RNA polymerase sigma factor [Polyangiaceae bacterium]